MVRIFLHPEVMVRHYLPRVFLRMRNMSEIQGIAKFERCQSQGEKATLLNKFSFAGRSSVCPQYQSQKVSINTLQ